MSRTGGGHTVRKAASLARSHIAESARQQANEDEQTDLYLGKPARKMARASTANRGQKPRGDNGRLPEWLIAIDFGTTFTIVAYHRRGTPADRIFTIDNFPGEKEQNRKNRQIPTELWYPQKDIYPSGHVKPHDVRLRFGNEVHRMAEVDDGFELRQFYSDADRVTMPKLLLDHTPYAQTSKERLRETIRFLKVNDHIEEEKDVFFHFFRGVLRATKRLLASHFNDESTVEMIYCVPVYYSPSAFAILGAQLERAMKEVRFGTNGDSPCNIFIVHEAEAHATQALVESLNELERGETFVEIDCGGGTTDIGIYRIAATEPLRLGAEVHEPTGAMVGAGDLNDKFRTLVRSILHSERYLEQEGETFDTIIAAEVMFKFGNDIKRSFHYNDTGATNSVRIRGLKSITVDERIRKNYLVLRYQDLWAIFRPSVKKIGNMMEEAITNAKDSGYRVSKVIVVGGFGDTPCLQSYLLEKRDRSTRELGLSIKLCFSPRNTSATGVATGAIMRAINKTDGPWRIPCQSICILRHIPCDHKGTYPAAVLAQPQEWDVQQRAYYVTNTILWVVKKNATLLDAVHTVTFQSEHTFQPEITEWIIEEQLWASETSTLDLYKLDRPNNAAKIMEIGAVEFNIGEMKEQIQAVNKQEGKIINSVMVLVEMTVIDRNLEFTARWPATPEGQIIKGSRKFFNVASAFVPGTQ